MTRNIAAELRGMGIEDDDAEYQELERRDRARQKEACYQQYNKDLADYIAWRRNNPLGKKSNIPSSGRLRDMILVAQSSGLNPDQTQPVRPSKRP